MCGRYVRRSDKQKLAEHFYAQLKVTTFLLGLTLAALPCAAQTDTHLYSPGTNLERSELEQLETATRSIDIPMYSFTDRYLAEELATLARKGVHIRVYRDR